MDIIVMNVFDSPCPQSVINKKSVNGFYAGTQVLRVQCVNHLVFIAQLYSCNSTTRLKHQYPLVQTGQTAWC